MTISFNSRTPGGVRQVGKQARGTSQAVSIHAPREGCDNDGYLTHIGRYTFQFTHPGRGATYLYEAACVGDKFQFTHPGRGATYLARSETSVQRVSIHAPREGCDILATKPA